MAKGPNQKLKLLFLARIFMAETDEEHGLSCQELIQRLNEYEVTEDRKTLYLDLEELRYFGMDIVSDLCVVVACGVGALDFDVCHDGLLLKKTFL